MAQSVAIIGAGIAGLSCGESLSRAGFQVSIYEKSRGLSGRSSTRHYQEHRFDHGAQFFTCKSDSFRNFVESGIVKGMIAPWHPRIFRGLQKSSWYVGVPGMSSLGKLFNVSELVTLESLITEIQKVDGRWQIKGFIQEEPFMASYDHLVLAVPSVQATALLQKIQIHQLENATEFKNIIKIVFDSEMTPCWTVMLSMGQEFGNLWPYDVFQASEDLINQVPIAWVAKNNTKPNRPNILGKDDWVIQASPAWSSKYLEADGSHITELISAELQQLTGLSIQQWIIESFAHRWRYSRASNPQRGPTYQYSQENDFGLCGDYFTISRIESAYLSGLDLASAMISKQTI